MEHVNSFLINYYWASDAHSYLFTFSESRLFFTSLCHSKSRKIPAQNFFQNQKKFSSHHFHVHSSTIVLLNTSVLRLHNYREACRFTTNYGLLCNARHVLTLTQYRHSGDAFS